VVPRTGNFISAEIVLFAFICERNPENTLGDARRRDDSMTEEPPSDSKFYAEDAEGERSVSAENIATWRRGRERKLQRKTG